MDANGNGKKNWETKQTCKFRSSHLFVRCQISEPSESSDHHFPVHYYFSVSACQRTSLVRGIASRPVLFVSFHAFRTASRSRKRWSYQSKLLPSSRRCSLEAIRPLRRWLLVDNERRIEATLRSEVSHHIGCQERAHSFFVCIYLRCMTFCLWRTLGSRGDTSARSLKPIVFLMESESIKGKKMSLKGE